MSQGVGWSTTSHSASSSQVSSSRGYTTFRTSTKFLIFQSRNGNYCWINHKVILSWLWAYHCTSWWLFTQWSTAGGDWIGRVCRAKSVNCSRKSTQLMWLCSFLSGHPSCPPATTIYSIRWSVNKYTIKKSGRRSRSITFLASPCSPQASCWLPYASTSRFFSS